jgi:carbon-monoxide dehydrogenase small subunit
LAQGAELSPVQQAFLDQGAVQCGYCTAGMLMSATALLERNPKPSVPEIKKALEGNLCRCTGYNAIVAAIQQASGQGVEPVMR